MSWEMIFVFAVLTCSFVAMLWEKLSVDLVAMLAFGALLSTGVLTPNEGFAVFSNQAPITVACMFILSAALERTGVIDAVAHRLNLLVGKSDWSLLLVVLPFVAVISAFVNNTPVVVVFMPIIITLAASRGLKPSKLLIPLSFASIFGGTCTLIGTSTNILVSSSGERFGQAPLGMFELAKIGVILTVVGIVYLLVLGRKILPGRETLASLLQSTDSKEYLTEAVIVSGSALIGKRLADTPLKNQPKARVLEVIRGGQPLSVPLNEIILEQGDQLRLATVLSSVMEIKQWTGLEISPQSKLGLELTGSQKAAIVECVVGPRSSLLGRTIRQLDFRRRYNALVLAVHRQGVNVRRNFADIRLQFGDTLLIEGAEPSIRQLRDNRDFLMLLDVPQSVPRRNKQWMAVCTISLVVAMAALGVLPISVLALVGAVMVVVVGCLAIEEAYSSIDWRIICLILGMLAVGEALEKTKGAEWLAHNMIGAFGNLGPHAVLTATILAASVMTNVLSNNAVAVVMTPIVLQIASVLEVDGRPFLIGVAAGASFCFATPIGYQTNTLVYGAGGYLFRDFLKVGIPLNLIFWLLSSILIPKFWPF